MPSPTTDNQVRLKNIITCLTVTANTLKTLSDCLRDPVLVAISNTTWSLLDCAETITQNRKNCTQLLEQTNQLLDTIIILHIESETRDLPPQVLKQTGYFMGILQKVHAFVEAQHRRSKIKHFFHQGEMNTLLKDCKAGLQQGIELFHVNTMNAMTDMIRMEQEAQKRQLDVLQLIEALSDGTSSEEAYSFNRRYSGSYTSSNSMFMLPSEPKIFHGRELEVAEILKQFTQGTPRTVILGAGGIGKTSLARVILHHRDIINQFKEHRVFVECETTSSKLELGALIGAHLGLQPGKDLTQPIVQHFAGNPPSLLILDNLETLWEPTLLRSEIEDFLALLADVDHLALLITMRGVERPAKVQWTRPFVKPLQPLPWDAAHKMFVDIADDCHETAEVDKVLLVTDNMPLAISLLASLADVEGCTRVLSRWEKEKTSMISGGYDRRSNLDLSISISLSSPRVISEPDSLKLLSLLSMLPDGLSDLELVQSGFPIKNIQQCKVALIRTSLVYVDSRKRLKVLVPIREYMQKSHPSDSHMIHPLLNYYNDLLESFQATPSPQIVARVSSNYSNIQNILRNELHRDNPDLGKCIYSACHVNRFSRHIGQGVTYLMDAILEGYLDDCAPQPMVYFMTELFNSASYRSIPNAEVLMAQALEYFDHIEDSDLRSYPTTTSHIKLFPELSHFVRMLYLWPHPLETPKDSHMHYATWH
ncbi:hypothetical protein DFH06DRAFT_722321, partial [Mycena polygramma]